MIFGPYSPIRQAVNLYFTAGQVGVNPKTKQAPKSVSAQTKQALENLKQLLAEAGLNLNQVIKTTVYLRDMGDFAAMNNVYVQYFESPRPARSCVAVSELPRLASNPLLVEIEAVVSTQGHNHV